VCWFVHSFVFGEGGGGRVDLLDLWREGGGGGGLPGYREL